ncbi:hypothetical protein JKP88DRAFT_247714 [Tribonema minus]|uniref:Uncharacterized protein n=1 Tax=Tribonema minus TaxID=303371 RepID=A0A836CAZ8_9STRA|nr:hypothetical protein JKP88DRAFT_247714 [Tribonema minus]
MSSSGVLQARLRRWTSPERPVRIYLKMEDDQETAAFEDVLWATYHNRLPDAEKMTVVRALSIAQTADKYVVERVMSMCAAWLGEQGGFSWDEMLAVCSAPFGIRERYPVTVQERVMSTLVEQLGDLELSMIAPEQKKELLALPQPALFTLLRSDALAVAAESTVAVVALGWALHRGK